MQLKSLARVLAHLCGDGYVGEKYLRYCNTCTILLDEFETDILFLFDDINIVKGKVNSGTRFIQVDNKKILFIIKRFLKSYKSKDIAVPDILLKSTWITKKAFIRAFYDDEGCASLRFSSKKREWKRNVTLCSNSLLILEQIADLLSFKGIKTNRIIPNKASSNVDNSFILSITGKKNFELFRKYINFNHPRKKHMLNLILLSYAATPAKRSVLANNLRNHLDNIKIKSGQLSRVPARKGSTIQNVGSLDFRVRNGYG